MWDFFASLKIKMIRDGRLARPGSMPLPFPDFIATRLKCNDVIEYDIG